MTTTKLDLTKEYKAYYTAKTTPEVVEFDEAQFLTVEGKGAHGSKEFTVKIEALYPIAYGVKNLCKKQSNDFGAQSSKGFGGLNLISPHWKLPVRNGDGNFLFVCQNS
ncbi:MAG: hypothetical protein ACUVQ8_07305 [Nitrososphaeria archaeon]